MSTESSVREFYEGCDSMPSYRGIPMLCVEGLHELLERTAFEFLSPGDRVLDVGCGRGALSLRLHDRGLVVDACDELDLCMCKEQVNFTCTSAEELDPGVMYDSVFMVELLEHTESPFQLLRLFASPADFLRKGSVVRSESRWHHMCVFLVCATIRTVPVKFR